LKKNKGKNIKKTKQIDTDFLYNIGDNIVYLGGLYEVYKNKTFQVIKRSKEKSFYKWYTIKHEDETILNVKEAWIGREDNSTKEDSNES
jgi:hypothetical protein